MEYLLVNYPKRESLLNNESSRLLSVALFPKHYEIYKQTPCLPVTDLSFSALDQKMTAQSKQKTITIYP